MLIDTRQVLHQQECADLCRSCEGCCWYLLEPLCPEWADPPDCTERLPQECVFIYHQMNSKTEGGCADCCDDFQTPEGEAECNCGDWYAIGSIFDREIRCSTGQYYLDEQGERVYVPCCDSQCANGKPCTPIATTSLEHIPECDPIPGGPVPGCGSIRPVYKWRDKCWTLRRARRGSLSGEGQCVNTPKGKPWCNSGWWDQFPEDWPPCARSQLCGNGSSEICSTCCKDCNVEIFDWCEWGGELVTIDYYCGGFGGPFCDLEKTNKECGDCNKGCGDDPGPPSCHGTCDETCPDGQRCCPPNKAGERCFCLPESIECDAEGPCDLGGECCPFPGQSHSLSVDINVKAAFEKGPSASMCTGTLEDTFAEAFGGQSLRWPVGLGTVYGLDMVCGNNDSMGDELLCSSLDMCGGEPDFPGSGPTSSAPTKCVPNCSRIDKACCPDGGLITDFVECGQGNIPHTAPSCPDGLKGYTAFGQRHLGMQMTMAFTLNCTSGGGNTYNLGQKGLLSCPVFKLGHRCTNNNKLRFGCSPPACCFGGQPQNFFPDSHSIGTQGTTLVPGYFSGSVEFNGAQLPDCKGVVAMNVTFVPDEPSYLPISFSSGCNGLDHPCQGTGSVYQWFDWDVELARIPEFGGDQLLAGRIRENCGMVPPPMFDPQDSGLVQEVKALHEASGGARTEFCALELPSAIEILQLGFANRSACGTSPPVGMGRTYETRGFAGCDMANGSHACTECPGTVVDLAKQGWNLGMIRAYGRMTYS